MQQERDDVDNVVRTMRKDPVWQARLGKYALSPGAFARVLFFRINFVSGPQSFLTALPYSSYN